jgi:uncharacterized protein (DUF488 family)
MSIPFYTVGHSTRSINDFAVLLSFAEVELIVDIRTIPQSRQNPQYSQKNLPHALAAFGIHYEHLAQLGGLRKKSKDVPPDVNGLWQNSSFHNYADYALSEEFHEGLIRLLYLGREQRTALMCAEFVWWRCHRRIVADYLIAHKELVFHLMGERRIEPAQLTKGAIIRTDGKVVYPQNP